MELMTASRQWSSRPDDERFESLPAMFDHFEHQRANSRSLVVPSNVLEAQPLEDNKGLTVHGANGHDYAPTFHAFGQLATLSGAPAGYLRALPSPLAADCINYGLKVNRPTEDTGVLLYKNGDAPTLRAVTGPKYGRVWNADVTRALMQRFGDGITGDFRVPGEFGNHVDVTKANTTLYAGERDMFVFLADEEHRIEIPNRRDGEPGSLARGFFVWNSEIGACTLGIATFLFDYVCCNRIVWGAKEYDEIKIRHSSGAPERFLAEVQPALESYARSSTGSITRAISDAREQRIASGVDQKARDEAVADFLRARWSKNQSAAMMAVHRQEEGRPIETRWDVVTAATAYARGIEYQDERVEIEREAGKLLAA